MASMRDLDLLPSVSHPNGLTSVSISSAAFSLTQGGSVGMQTLRGMKQEAVNEGHGAYSRSA